MATRGYEGVTVADLTRKAAKPSKYRNVKVVVDGMTFDSKREAQYWRELQLRERAGEISKLSRQAAFDLRAPSHDLGRDFVVVAWYFADFVYFDAKNVRHVVDVKGGSATKTAIYRLKKRWLFLQDGIDIEEV